MQLEKAHKMSGCRVLLLGQQPHIIVQQRAKTLLHHEALDTVRQRALNWGAQPDRLYLLRAASGKDSPGHKQIVTTDQISGYRWFPADGIILEKPCSGASFQTADCVTAVFHHKRTYITGMVHCGRPAGEPKDGENIITMMLDKLIKHDLDIAELEVYLTGSIAGADFKHNENQTIRDKALPFLDEFGPDVFVDVDNLELDMVRVVTAQLLAAGLCAEQITHDGLNTYSEPGLTSHRESSVLNLNRKTANTVLTVT